MKREARPRSNGRAEQKRTWGDLVYQSLIAKSFRRFTNWLYSLLINGFFGKMFTAYSAEEDLFFDSHIARFFRGGNRAVRMATNAKSRLAQAFENSRILSAISHLSASLIHRRLKTYGAFLLSTGAYGIVSYIIRVYVLEQGGEDLSVIFWCAAFIVTSFPMMASRETFASAAQKSKLMSAFLFNGLGLPRDAFDTNAVYLKRYSLVTAIGMFFGALVYFIHPAHYVGAAVILLSLSLIFSFPEIGVLVFLALVPLSSLFSNPSAVLFVSVFVTAIAYFIKLIRGKRVIHFGLLDVTIAAFSVIYLIGGIISAGKADSLRASVLCFVLMMAYFLTVNLIRTKEWVNRCITTVLVFAVLSGSVGLLQMLTGSFDPAWLDMSLFSGISVRITATFDNPNVYATYLLLVTPFALAGLLRKGRLSKKLPSLLCLAFLLLCLVQTWSRGAWLGALISAVLFFLVYSRRTLPYLLAGGVALPLFSGFLPNNVVLRFTSIAGASDSSAAYRISAWRGVLRMLRENWLGGIGIGETAFSSMYPIYSYAGVAGIQHAHNLYLQILSETGVVGLFLLVLVIVFFVQNCFEYIYLTRNEGETVIAVAGLTAIAAVLIMGLTDHIWYNYRVFAMFWAVIGLVCAYIRIGLSEFKRFRDYHVNTDYSMNVDLNVDNL